MTTKRSLRTAAAALGIAALAAAGLPAAPASAGLLDPLAEVAGGVGGGILDPVVQTVDGIAGDLVPTGWLYDGTTTSLREVRTAIKADALWAQGYTGGGIGVALVDTGVVPVAGLTSGNVVNGADLSFESQTPAVRHLDTFGHGTHMAGIIAGRTPGGALDLDRFQGVAPDARLTSLKVAASDGAADVSQVIAAVDWVVEHRNDDPKNPIRVLNLSYGTDGVQDRLVDPLTHAVENAWRAGIVVVVSGGNHGSSGALNNPAYDPFVIAVGSSDTRGTALTTDDVVPSFSARGTAARRVDVTAPGRSIASLADPGSYLDSAHPAARSGDGLFKGSGTSQSAAVVSGAVALLLDQRPGLKPDQVKALLRGTAAPMPLADAAGRGAGQIDLAAAATAKTPTSVQTHGVSRGTGSLEKARGTSHVADGNVELRGERDVRGPWRAATWAKASSAGTAWVGGKWNGVDWTASCWCEDSWAGRSWAGRAWAGTSWAGRAWAGRAWAGRAWAGRAWAGRAWAGRAWAGGTWSGRAWA